MTNDSPTSTAPGAPDIRAPKAQVPTTQARNADASGAHLPTPPSERGAWLLALALGALGVAVLVAVLSGVVGRTSTIAPHAGPPAVLVAAVTPAPSAVQSAGRASADGVRVARGGSGTRGSTRAAIVARPSSAQ